MFYTYLWLREDGTPYYVGKGSGNRAFRNGCPSRDVIPGWIDEPDHNRIIVQEHPCESEAFIVEKFFIAYYGRRDTGAGRLMNLTDGGEGQAGRVVPKEVCKKLSNAGIGHVVATKTRDKIRVGLLGRTKTHCVRGHERSPRNLTNGGSCILCLRTVHNQRRREKRNGRFWT